MNVRRGFLKVLVFLACLFVVVGIYSSVSAASNELQFYFWPVDGESPVGSHWEVSPNEPDTTDVVHFVGTTETFGNACYLGLWCGGGTYVTVDSDTRTAELWVQGVEGFCPDVYMPVYGYIEGQIGPLTDGDWLFFCDDPAASFNIPLHVSSVKVVHPNGGDVMVADSVYSIVWEDHRPGGARQGQYRLDYSCDGGTTWAAVSEDIISGVCSYNWPVPRMNSDDCFIRLRDAVDANVYDVSDEAFTIEVQGPWMITVDDEATGDFATIQAAIEAADDGDTVILLPGTYRGDGNRDIDFMGKAITVRSQSGPAGCIIDCEGEPTEPHRAFSFVSGEDANSVLQGLTIIGAYTTETDMGGAVYCLRSWPSIRNCVFQNNVAIEGGGAIDYRLNCSMPYDSSLIPDPAITNCTFVDNMSAGDGGAIHVQGGSRDKLIVRNSILWRNSEPDLSISPFMKCGIPSVPVLYSVLQSDWYQAEFCLAVDPCLADPNGGDLHVKSQAGRWDVNAEQWVMDETTSPCIDTGDPLAAIGYEVFPNGGRLNMGAYGGTQQASRSWFDAPVCETILPGDINGDCKVDFTDFGFILLNWLRDEGPEYIIDLTPIPEPF